MKFSPIEVFMAFGPVVGIPENKNLQLSKEASLEEVTDNGCFVTLSIFPTLKTESTTVPPTNELLRTSAELATPSSTGVLIQILSSS